MSSNIRVPITLAMFGCGTAIVLAVGAMYSPNLKENTTVLQGVIISSIGIAITGLTAAGTAYQTQVKAESSSSVIVADNNGTQITSSDPPAQVVEAPSYSYLPPDNLEPLPVPLPKLEDDWGEPSKRSPAPKNQNYFPGE